MNRIECLIITITCTILLHIHWINDFKIGSPMIYAILGMGFAAAYITKLLKGID